MRAFLTGASGFVGSHVLRELLGAGARVRCLVRDPGRFSQPPGNDVEVVPGDLRELASFAAAVSGCDLLVHCAADYRLYARDPDEIYRTNVTGTHNLLAAAATADVGRVVYTSSVGALGLRADGAAADERTPVVLEDMVGHYKRSKFLAEREVEAWVDKGLAIVTVNPSTPVGEGDLKPTATGKLIVDFLNRRVPAWVDTGLNLIDVRDVATGHLLAAEKGQPGEKYILGNRNMSLREIYATLARIAEIPEPRVRLPHWIPLAVGALDTAAARLLGREPHVALEAVRLARYKMYFSADRAVRELGLPQSSIEAALERAVDWYRANGYVGAA